MHWRLRHAIPTIYAFREFANAGGLMSYGTQPFDMPIARQVSMSAEFSKAKSPATCRCMQPTKFQFVINLKTAKTLGLTIPPAMLARADEVIE